MTFLNNKNLMFAYKLARKARKNKQEVIFKYCLLDNFFDEKNIEIFEGGKYGI